MFLILVIITVGVTFAAFTFVKVGTVENTLETGTVTLTYTEGKTGILLNEAYPMSDEKGKVLVGENNVFDFTVQANLSRTMSIGYEVTAVKLPINDVTPLEDDEVKLYLERAIDPDTTYQEVFAPSNFIPIESQTEIGSPLGSMILDSGIFSNEGVTIHNYRLRMWVDENTEMPSGESRKYGIKINVYAKQNVFPTPVQQKNENIIAIYQYDQITGSPTFCVTGEESTCVELKQAPKIYETGTIIKYQVNDTLEKYFHVMFDNGDTLTLQQRENTVYNILWNANADNSQGPLTVLPNLENATSSWTNVLDQTYTLGTTIFKDNAYTGCRYLDNKNTVVSCITNPYTLKSRTAKARMMTVQEAFFFGCVGTEQSCPVWMYNYLLDSASYGGTVSDRNGGYAYWLSTASVIKSSWAWRVYYTGHIGDYNVTSTSRGARAVVKINK